MKSKTLFSDISRLKTTDLLIAKVNCTKRGSLYRSIKLGLVGGLGILVTQMAHELFSALPMTVVGLSFMPLSAYSVVGYLIVDALEAETLARKELINDILTLRSNKAKRRS